jgi:hypothetical protein
MSDGIKNPNSFGLDDIIGDLPKHVWDSSAEPPTKHPPARKAAKVKRGKKVEA